MYALYYARVLLGVITDPSAYPGGIEDLCRMLSPDNGAATVVEIPATVETGD